MYAHVSSEQNESFHQFVEQSMTLSFYCNANDCVPIRLVSVVEKVLLSIEQVKDICYEDMLWRQ